MLYLNKELALNYRMHLRHFGQILYPLYHLIAHALSILIKHSDERNHQVIFFTNIGNERYNNQALYSDAFQ